MNLAQTPAAAPLLPHAATVGFATGVAMWIVGYLTHLPALQAPPVLVGALLLVTFSVGIGLGSRRDPRPGRAGAAAALVAALVNLLVLGAILAQPDATNALRPGWLPTLLGYFAFCAALGAVSGVATSRIAPGGRGPQPTTAHWLARFGVVACFAALPVLLSGGLVTSTGTGLAVPDWPASYNANMFLYPLSRMTGGIYYEHAHRLFGSLVGLTTLVLLVFVLLAERRAGVRLLVGAVFIAVCLQGVLGGLRVTAATATTPEFSPDTLADNSRSLALAMTHGAAAQIVFAALCVLAATLSARWRSAPPAAASDRADPVLRALAPVLVGALVLQLLLGSATRHLHHTHALISHIVFALVVAVIAVFVGARAGYRHADEPAFRRFGRGLMHAVGLQIALGLVAVFLLLPYDRSTPDSPAAVLFATAHQAVGALLLGGAALIAAWSRRLLRPSPAHATATAAPATGATV